MERLLRLGLLAAVLVGIVFVTSAAAAAPSLCTHGASSIGPAVLIHSRLVKSQSDVPHIEGCLPH